MHNFPSTDEESAAEQPIESGSAPVQGHDRRSFLRNTAAGAVGLLLSNLGAPTARGEKTEGSEETEAPDFEEVLVTMENAQMVRGIQYDETKKRWKPVNGYWAGETRTPYGNEVRPIAQSYDPVKLVLKRANNEAEVIDAWATMRELDREPSQLTVDRIRKDANRKYKTILTDNGDGSYGWFNGEYDEREQEADETPPIEGVYPATVTVHSKDPADNQTYTEFKTGWAFSRKIPAQEQAKEKDCCNIRVVYINTQPNEPTTDPRARFTILNKVNVDVDTNIEIEAQPWFPDNCTCRATGQSNRIRHYYGTNQPGTYAYRCPNTGRMVHFRDNQANARQQLQNLNRQGHDFGNGTVR